MLDSAWGLGSRAGLLLPIGEHSHGEWLKYIASLSILLFPVLQIEECIFSCITWGGCTVSCITFLQVSLSLNQKCLAIYFMKKNLLCCTVVSPFLFNLRVKSLLTFSFHNKTLAHVSFEMHTTQCRPISPRNSFIVVLIVPF